MQSSIEEYNQPTESVDIADKVTGSKSTEIIGDQHLNKSSGPNPDGSAPGVIYARVSSSKQVKNGNSLGDQGTRLKKLAAEHDISLVCEPIEDDAETGTDFDRPGIKRVSELAREGEISHVLVDDIDRIGRRAVVGLYYIYQLRQCGVRIVTPQDGVVDIEEMQGLIVTCLKSLFSQMENESRSRRAKEGRIEAFKAKKWRAAFNTIPLGYQADGDGWIEIDEAEASVVRRAVDWFLGTSVQGAYRKTVDSVHLERYDVSSRRLKDLLQKPVYIGEPTYRRSSEAVIDGVEDSVTVYDKNLEIITERQFQQVQEKMDKITDRKVSGDSEAPDVTDFVRDLGIDVVLDASRCVELRCPEPNCDGKLVKNGTRMSADEKIHNYKCVECSRQRRWPNQREQSRMREAEEDDHE